MLFQRGPSQTAVNAASAAADPLAVGSSSCRSLSLAPSVTHRTAFPFAAAARSSRHRCCMSISCCACDASQLHCWPCSGIRMRRINLGEESDGSSARRGQGARVICEIRGVEKALVCGEISSSPGLPANHTPRASGSSRWTLPTNSSLIPRPQRPRWS